MDFGRQRALRRARDCPGIETTYDVRRLGTRFTGRAAVVSDRRRCQAQHRTRGWPNHVLISGDVGPSELLEALEALR